jgi:hypothetical protein
LQQAQQQVVVAAAPGLLLGLHGLVQVVGAGDVARHQALDLVAVLVGAQPVRGQR